MNAKNNVNNSSSKNDTVLLDIVIPKVSRYTSARYVAKVFYENKIAMVRHVKFVQYKFARGDIYKRAIIQLACWFDSPTAQNIIHKIQTQNFARTIHKDENAWTLVEATEDDKNTDVQESAFFKIQNVPKYRYSFKGEVQERETVYPVFPNQGKCQFVYYREPKLVGSDIDWSTKTPNDVIFYFSHIYEVLEKEDNYIIDGLKQFMKKQNTTAKTSIDKYYVPNIVRYQ